MSKTKDIIDEALGAVELAKSEPVQKKVIPRPKEDNEDLVKELQLLQTQKERARMKAEDILQRINDIESSA